MMFAIGPDFVEIQRLEQEMEERSAAFPTLCVRCLLSVGLRNCHSLLLQVQALSGVNV